MWASIRGPTEGGLQMKCSNCGSSVKKGNKFCNNCGAEIVVEETAKNNSAKITKSLSTKMILIGVAIVVVVAVIAAVVTGIVVKNIDRNTMKNGEVTLSKLEKELNKTNSELSKNKSELASVNEQLKNQKKKIKPLKEIYDKSLASGEYEVGTDLEPGIYHFVYKTNEKDGWGDYIYVTHKGSKGTEETLGGTKYDFRVEGAKNGDTVSLKLVAGDKVFLDGEMDGTFEAAKQ